MVSVTYLQGRIGVVRHTVQPARGVKYCLSVRGNQIYFCGVNIPFFQTVVYNDGMLFCHHDVQQDQPLEIHVSPGKDFPEFAPELIVITDGIKCGYLNTGLRTRA